MKIKELLSDESKWTQRAGARDKRGIEVYPTSANAVCWCLSGAARKCYPNVEAQLAIIQKVTEWLGDEPYACMVASWNDRTTFARVKQCVTELDI